MCPRPNPPPIHEAGLAARAIGHAVRPVFLTTVYRREAADASDADSLPKTLTPTGAMGCEPRLDVGCGQPPLPAIAAVASSRN